jgi:peptidoglycan/xylan/chitin deacetylase (PgdA/CDA1 family)
VHLGQYQIRLLKAQQLVHATMNLQKILATPIRFPIRSFIAAIAVLLLCAGLLPLTGAWLSPPRFLLDRGQRNVDPLDYPLWRRVSDGLAGRKYAVLTFDDGPYGDGVDEHILEILRRHHARAMFFLICSHLNARTDHVLGEIEEGGNLIGNHSYDHLKLNQLNLANLQHQVEGCSARIAQVDGHRPSYFRPPFGQTSSHVMQVVQSAGMEQVLWNANSQDSWLKQPEQILYWSLEETENGSILLMHDKPTTAAVLDHMMTELERRGFRFVLPTEPSSVTRED